MDKTMLNKLNESARRMLTFLGPLISWVIDPEIGAVLCSFFEKLQGDKALLWWEEFKKFLRKETCWLKNNPYLRRIANGNLKATDGKRTIVGAKEMFPGYFDGDYAKLGTDVLGKPSPGMSFEVYELVKNGRFAQIFGTFSVSLDSLCWEQDKILAFVEEHPELLHPEGCGMFFLFKVKFNENTKNEQEEFFVADVDRRDDGRLETGVRRLSSGDVWGAEDRHRFVVPQLA